LLERNWIKVLGHKDVPGKPTLYGTTKTFLDYFNLKSLDQLPTLAEIKDLDSIHPELELDEDAAENATDHAEQGNVELENNISNDTESSADNVNSILNENDTVEESPGEDITEQQASEESVTDLDPSTSPDDVEPQEKIENQDADKKQVINV
jgi:segregation and condensation protein B